MRNSIAVQTRALRVRLLAIALIAFAIVTAIASCGSKSDSSATANGQSANGAANGTSATPAPAETAAAATPVSTGSASVELGEKVFKLRCTPCHGPDGHGTGPLAATLNPKPRNFHDATYMHAHEDAELLGIIHNGKGGMPPWKAILSEVEMQSALMYVRQFAAKP